MTTMTETTIPRAWVGCLACYNEGRLVGEWFDGTEAGDITTEQLHKMAKMRPVQFPPHEELWVMDHEGYGDWLRGECSPHHAQEIAERIAAMAELGEAAGIYAEAIGVDYAMKMSAEEFASDFEAHYMGEYDSGKDYAAERVEEYLEATEKTELGQPFGEHMPDLRYYFDTEQIWRDLSFSGYSEHRSANYRMHIFDA